MPIILIYKFLLEPESEIKAGSATWSAGRPSLILMRILHADPLDRPQTPIRPKTKLDFVVNIKCLW